MQEIKIEFIRSGNVLDKVVQNSEQKNELPFYSWVYILTELVTSHRKLNWNDRKRNLPYNAFYLYI